MTEMLNQAWEDVASDVTDAIEKAVRPRLKKAVDEVYTGLLEATQDYLSANLAFNIASRISAAEREAASARQEADKLNADVAALLGAARCIWAVRPTNWLDDDDPEASQAWHQIGWIVGAREVVGSPALAREQGK